MPSPQIGVHSLAEFSKPESVSLNEEPVGFLSAWKTDWNAQGALASQHFTARFLSARKARFELAVGGAAVAIQGVPVIARFVDEQAVAAVGGAGSAAAIRLRLAGRRATVERDRVAIVATLGAFSLPVPAARRTANTGLASALVAELELA